MRKTKGLTQAYEMQDFAYAAAMSLRESLKDTTGKVVIDKEAANAVATLIRAWQSAQEQVRIHRGKPLPGSLRPERRAPKAQDPGI